MGTYMESWINSLTYYRRRSLFLFEVKHMNAARYFRRYFSSNRLKNIYSDKIKYRATVGMDRITPAAFENKLDENVRLISQKVLSGKYNYVQGSTTTRIRHSKFFLTSKQNVLTLSSHRIHKQFYNQWMRK